MYPDYALIKMEYEERLRAAERERLALAISRATRRGQDAPKPRLAPALRRLFHRRPAPALG